MRDMNSLLLQLMPAAHVTTRIHDKECRILRDMLHSLWSLKPNPCSVYKQSSRGVLLSDLSKLPHEDFTPEVTKRTV